MLRPLVRGADVLIVLLSAKGAPGVTSTALTLARTWPRSVLLVEADLGGPSVFPGYLGGRVVQPGGVLGLAVAAARGELGGQSWLADQLWEQTVPLPQLHPDPAHRRSLLPGLTSPAEAPALRDLWGPLASQLVALEASGTDVLVDVGRLTASGDVRDPLLTLADLVCVVTRSNLPAVTCAVRLVEHRVGRADRETTAWRTLVVGPGRPYSVGEISKTMVWPVQGRSSGTQVRRWCCRTGRRSAAGSPGRS